MLACKEESEHASTHFKETGGGKQGKESPLQMFLKLQISVTKQLELKPEAKLIIPIFH